MKEGPRVAETVLLTCLALLCFASNSLLTRLGLADRQLDAATFTLVRLASGAATLSLLVRAQDGRWWPPRERDLVSPLALFAYAGPFSFAYLRIGASLGALVLFGTVQLTMMGFGVVRGERPRPMTWLGLALAVVGLAALTLPSASRPDPAGIALMMVAGVSWAVYSLRGKKARDPLATTAYNFLLTVPLAVVLSAVNLRHAGMTARGFTLAFVSGAVTSGLGYAIWYRALRGLTATRAAIVQLSVPVIAGLGAVGVLGERPSQRLLLCGAAVLGGVAITLLQRTRTTVAAK